MNIVKDMLTEKNKYSQSRVYLFWAILAYYLTLGILMCKGVNKNNNMDLNKFKIIIDALEYSMVLFAGYTFGGKFLEVVKTIGTKRSTPPKNDDSE
jgi:hypothetical protein